MMILYNGKIGARQYRLLIAVIDGTLVAYRPYVGWYLFYGSLEEE